MRAGIKLSFIAKRAYVNAQRVSICKQYWR